jgi:crotonobetainyl-CoA:carnitine CoA-transferase CaiB-like acyl-CoA transferase
MSEPSATGPLVGWKVIDLSRVLGGPYCTQLLGDLGADVIKIEPPQGDETRDWGPPFDDAGEAAYFMGINRNKKSVALDIRAPEGRDILLRLLGDADAMVENFKTGSLEKWGLGYDDVLKDKFPRLIHCRVTGFGSDGPLGGFPGYDAVLQAMCGWFTVNGPPEGSGVRFGIPLVDIGTGLFAANAILAAGLEREKSGLGQSVEASLFDTGIAFQHPHAPNWFLSGKAPVRVGNAHTNIAPYDAFPSKTVDIYLSVGNNGQFSRLCTALGAPEMIKDPRFANNSDRVQHKPALREALVKLLANKDGEALCLTLLQQGVPAGPILDMEGILKHPHTKHRKMVIEKDGYRGVGIPIKFSRTPGSIRKRPPTFGENDREVLRDAGFDEAEITRFVEAGVVLEQRRKAN